MYNEIELKQVCQRLESELQGLNKVVYTFAMKNEDYIGIISVFGQQCVEATPDSIIKKINANLFNDLCTIYSNLKKDGKL